MGLTSRSCNGQTPLRMANIQNMTTAAIEEYLAARKTLEKFDGAKPTKAPTAKTAKPAKSKPAKSTRTGRKPMSDAAKAALSKAATARWKAAKKAGKKHL